MEETLNQSPPPSELSAFFQLAKNIEEELQSSRQNPVDVVKIKTETDVKNFDDSPDAASFLEELPENFSLLRREKAKWRVTIDRVQSPVSNFYF